MSVIDERPKRPAAVAVISLPHEGDAAYTTESIKKEKRAGSGTQMLSCVVVQLFHIMNGMGMGYSSNLIPQLEDPDSDLRLTRDQNAWITSTFTIALPMGSLLGIWAMSIVGRLRIVECVMFPIIVGWIMTAMATSFVELLVARIIIGGSMGMAFNAAQLFITEVAEKDIRGSLSCLGTALSSLGIVISYIVGSYVPWRTTAWCFCAPPVVELALLLAFASESPVWLRDHGREAEGRKSSLYFYKDPDKVLSSSKVEDLSVWQSLKFLFGRPTALKPFLVITGLFLFQQLSGNYVMVYYGVTFYQETGNELDPYIATIVLGVIRFVFCTATAISAGQVGRRPVLIATSIGMCLCTICSGVATHTIFSIRGDGGVPDEWLSWVVVVCILLFVAFCSSGPTILPWSMMAEIFPHEVRNLAQPLNTCTSHAFMFAMLQLYPTLSALLGGSAGVQFLFAAMSFAMAAYVWAFVLETRGLTLQEIQHHFTRGVFYPGCSNRAQAGKESAVSMRTASSTENSLARS